MARVDDVGAGADHRERAATTRQRGAMDGGIDPRGQPAGDGQAAAGQCAGEITGVVAATGTGYATADNGDRRLPQQAGLAIDEQSQRRAWTVAQQRRVVRIAPPQQMVMW